MAEVYGARDHRVEGNRIHSFWTVILCHRPFPQLAPAAKFCTQQSNWVNLSGFVYIMVEMFAMKGDTDYPAKNSLVAGYLALAMVRVQERSMSLCCECGSLLRNSTGVVKMSSSATSAVHYRLFLRATWDAPKEWCKWPEIQTWFIQRGYSVRLCRLVRSSIISRYFKRMLTVLRSPYP